MERNFIKEPDEWKPEDGKLKKIIFALRQLTSSVLKNEPMAKSGLLSEEDLLDKFPDGYDPEAINH